jgi:ADP-ribosyl-[dinitrogen reductase] hydrolase
VAAADGPIDRSRGCLLGLAIGDAVGTTVEFAPRGSFAPLIDMVGGGPFGLRPGEWTDDTSMALCLATSLVECGGFDPVDQMQRYCRWRDEGYLSSNGRCFDIGNTVSAGLDRFSRTGNAFAGSRDPSSAGNGSIMRLAPVPIAYHRDEADVVHFCEESSRTTHGAEECVVACRLLGVALCRLLAGEGRDVLRCLPLERTMSEPLASIARGDYASKDRASIRSSGYVVHTLEAALWAFNATSSFEDAVLCAANLGEDADTVAAVCGQIAGAHYGLSGIPASWRERVACRDEILELADRLRTSMDWAPER